MITTNRDACRLFLRCGSRRSGDRAAESNSIASSDYGKNDFAEVCKNLSIDIDLKIILLNYQNYYVA